MTPLGALANYGYTLEQTTTVVAPRGVVEAERVFRLRFRGERPHPISCFRRWPNPTWRRPIGRQDSSGAVGLSAAPVENGDDRTVLEKIVLRAGWPAPAISEGASDCRGLTVQLGNEVMGEVGDFEAAAVQLTLQRLDVEATARSAGVADDRGHLSDGDRIGVCVAQVIQRA